MATEVIAPIGTKESWDIQSGLDSLVPWTSNALKSVQRHSVSPCNYTRLLGRDDLGFTVTLQTTQKTRQIQKKKTFYSVTPNSSAASITSFNPDWREHDSKLAIFIPTESLHSIYVCKYYIYTHISAWWFQPLGKYESVGTIVHRIWKKCSKPPTRYVYIYIIYHIYIYDICICICTLNKPSTRARALCSTLCNPVWLQLSQLTKLGPRASPEREPADRSFKSGFLN